MDEELDGIREATGSGSEVGGDVAAEAVVEAEGEHPSQGAESAAGGGREEGAPASEQVEMVPFKRVRDLQSVADRLRNDLAAERQTAARLRSELEQALEAYRTVVAAANPEVPSELIAGPSLQEVQESLRHGRELVEQVRARLVAQGYGAAMPVGTPERSGPDLSALSPREKILYGLARQAPG